MSKTTKENTKISMGKILEMYDNFEKTVRVNNNKLETIVEDNTAVIYGTRKDLLDKEVVSFGFYDDIMTIRVMC